VEGHLFADEVARQLSVAERDGDVARCTPGEDGNCDGVADDAGVDGDHFLGCEECDDTNADAHPGAVETCNRIDDDCDGTTDEDDAADALMWYLDADGYGAADSSTLACAIPGGYSATDDDCDDGDDAISPGATESCDGPWTTVLATATALRTTALAAAM
jgi:hypothetical protein